VIDSAVAPSTLDIMFGANAATDLWAANFYRQLVRLDRKPGPFPSTTVQDPSKVVGDLALSYTISDDGLTYTFKLDPKARFTDGTPIDSAAVKFSADRALALGPPGQSDWSGVQFATNKPTVSAPDATTIVITLQHPNSMLLESLAVPGPTAIYESSVFQQHPDVQGQAVNEYWSSHVAGGGGPYILDNYVPNQILTMHADPNYNGPTPARTQQVTVNFGQSESTLLLQARSGAADIIAGMTPDDMNSLSGDQTVDVLKFPVQFYYDLGLVNSHPPFDNQALRQALAYAVPYDQIVSQVAGGFGSAMYGPIPQTLAHYNADLSQPLPYDINKAKDLLAQANVATPLTVNMVILQGDTQMSQMATVIQQTWKQLGIDVNINTLAAAPYNTALNDHNEDAYMRVDGPAASDPGVVLSYDDSCPGSTGIGNRSKICIPELDQMLAQALATTDYAEQQKLYDQITTLWRNNYPKIILYNQVQGLVVSKKIKAYDWSDVAPVEVHGIVK
jgi:peptide/nickel transport system substrate-binding protein